jgi:hypothetical protein
VVTFSNYTSTHHDLLAADRRQSLDHVAQSLLSIFVGAIGGK